MAADEVDPHELADRIYRGIPDQVPLRSGHPVSYRGATRAEHRNHIHLNALYRPPSEPGDA